MNRNLNSRLTPTCNSTPLNTLYDSKNALSVFTQRCASMFPNVCTDKLKIYRVVVWKRNPLKEKFPRAPLTSEVAPFLAQLRIHCHRTDSNKPSVCLDAWPSWLEVNIMRYVISTLWGLLDFQMRCNKKVSELFIWGSGQGIRAPLCLLAS